MSQETLEHILLFGRPRSTKGHLCPLAFRQSHHMHPHHIPSWSVVSIIRSSHRDLDDRVVLQCSVGVERHHGVSSIPRHHGPRRHLLLFSSPPARPRHRALAEARRVRRLSAWRRWRRGLDEVLYLRLGEAGARVLIARVVPRGGVWVWLVLRSGTGEVTQLAVLNCACHRCFCTLF